MAGLTEQDIKDFMKDLEIKNSSSNTQWVFVTGTVGFENFNFSMMGLDVSISVKHTRNSFVRTRHLWIFNIYEKHGPYKIVLNCRTKWFSAYYGTELLGISMTTAEAAYTLYIKNHSKNTK